MLKGGSFIVFEGLDGSGKTTHMRSAREALICRGYGCISTREPSGGRVGALARDAVTRRAEFEPETLAMLFAADRFEHTVGEIIPALERGLVVLCDRYYYSSIAYQGESFGFDRIIALNKDTMDRITPDLVLFLDVPPEECVRRRLGTRTSEDLFDDVKLQKRVRENFLESFKLLRKSENITVIPAEGSFEAVDEAILREIEKIL